LISSYNLTMYIIEAYVTNAALAVDKPFSYYYDEEIALYTRIKVNFNNRSNVALVVGCKEVEKEKEEIEAELGFKLLKVQEVIDTKPIINQELFDMASWLAKTTLSPLISCINVMLPKYLKTDLNDDKPKLLEYLNKNDISNLNLTSKQLEIYNSLNDDMLASEARKLSTSIFNALKEKGAISLYKKESSYQSESLIIKDDQFLTLNSQQENVYKHILESEKEIFYLYGITGSGKTEVYLHLARDFLKKGKQVLILVPEIALTPQMIERVKQRFNSLAFYHSQLSNQERYEQYKRVLNGEISIVVGTRSSIFLPFSDLGLIIVDEEHDSSYKQDNTPCYDAKKVAMYRSNHNKAKLVLASATPSLDAYTRALKGEYELCTLEKRVNDCLPEVKLINLDQEVRKGSDYIYSDPLKEALSERFNKHEQAIILLNRRGYAPIVKCNKCGSTLMCKDCDLTLTYHKDENSLKCHQCGRNYVLPETCPNCKNKSLTTYGYGTKRAQEELIKLFPEVRICRMDYDSTRKKGAYEKILNDFGNNKYDVLLGTQMIAKGLDFPNATLVAILNADSALMHLDYNASKLAFDLLMQAAGRSGRSEKKGEVLIQTYNPNHYVMQAVLNQDYKYFYNKEMHYRSEANYPPYSHFVSLIISDENEKRALDSLNTLLSLCKNLSFNSYRPLKLNRLNNRYRYRILFKDKSLAKMVNDLWALINEYLANNKNSSLKVDVDPLYLE